MKVKKKNRFKTLLGHIVATIKRPEMVLLPGQLAFFLVLAIIPTITIISYGASTLNLSMDFLYDFMEKAFSPEIAQLLLGSATGSAGLKLTMAILICYYLASNGTNSVIVTSNTIYGIKNGNWFKRRLKAIAMAIIFVLLIVFMLIFPIFGNLIIDLIESVNLNADVTRGMVAVFNYLQSPIMWIFLFILIKIIYIMAPDRKIIAHNANYGAIFTTFTWIVTTYIYSFYINNIANYSAFYGNLTTLCVLMIWFYLISYFFVLGMSLNYQRENDELVKNGVILNEN